jgi:hypothetical protein
MGVTLLTNFITITVTVMTYVVVCAQKNNITALFDSDNFLLKPWSHVANYSIVYNKIPKCASSTTAGIFRTIANNNNLYTDTAIAYKFAINSTNLTDQREIFSLTQDLSTAALETDISNFRTFHKLIHTYIDKSSSRDNCVQFWHEVLKEPFILATHQAYEQWRQLLEVHVEKYLKHQVFLATTVRDPLARCYSHWYYFHVSKMLENDTSTNRLNFMKEHCKGYMLKRMQATFPVALRPQNATSAMSLFNFIAVAERMDECLVILKELLHLGYEDILHVETKTDHAHPTAQSETDPVILKFIKSDFITANKEEYQLVSMANEHIDLFSSVIPEFEKKLSEYLIIKESMGYKNCSSKKCACLFRDNGCCIPCLKQVAHHSASILSQYYANMDAAVKKQ